MLKSAFLLFLVAGLAIGLWIGYNPRLHKDGLQVSSEARLAYLDLRANATKTFDRIALPFRSDLHLSANKPVASSSQLKTSWKQIDATLTRLWVSIKAYFARLSVKASLSG